MLIIFLYVIFGLYFTLLFVSFFGSFKKARTVDTIPSEIRKISIIILIEEIEGFIEENILSILSQNYSNKHCEYIFIDKTKNGEILKEFGYKYPEKNIKYFYTPQMNLPIIKEILEHKAQGDYYLFIQSINKVYEDWAEDLMVFFDQNTDAVKGKTLIAVDEKDPRYFKAIDTIFKTTLLRDLGKHNFTSFLQFDNIAFRKSSLFSSKSMKEFKVSTGSRRPETAVYKTMKKRGFKQFFTEKQSENIFKNPLVSLSPLNLVFAILFQITNSIPLVYFLIYLKGGHPFLPLMIILFAKFIAEGLIVSRGARIYAQQHLLNDFWTWYFFNPPLSFLTFFFTFFSKNRFYKPKVW